MYHRRGGPPGPYSSEGSYSPSGQGEHGFRPPMPRFQSSPRTQHHQFISLHNAHGHPRSPPMSPITPAPGDHNRNRHMSMPSPNTLSYPRCRMTYGSPAWGQHNNTSGHRGRGRVHSGGSSPRYNPDCNPGGTDDISKYFHPSMLEDPWEKLKPVPVTQTITTTTTSARTYAM